MERRDTVSKKVVWKFRVRKRGERVTHQKQGESIRSVHIKECTLHLSIGRLKDSHCDYQMPPRSLAQYSHRVRPSLPTVVPLM